MPVGCIPILRRNDRISGPVANKARGPARGVEWDSLPNNVLFPGSFPTGKRGRSPKRKRAPIRGPSLSLVADDQPSNSQSQKLHMVIPPDCSRVNYR